MSVFFVRKPSLFLVLLFLAAFRLPSLFIDYYDEDELMYATCASELLAGATPYVDYAEQKTPAMHYIYAGLFLLGGERNLYFVHAFALFLVLLTAYFVYRVVLLVLGDAWIACLGALAYGIYVTAFDESHMAANAELFFNAPFAVAVFYFVRFYFVPEKCLRLLVYVGFWIAVIFLMKQQGGALLAAVGAFLLLDNPKQNLKQNLLAGLIIALAFLLSLCFVALCAAAVYGTDFLKDALYWLFVFPVDQASAVGRASWTEVLGVFFRRQGPLWIVQALLWLALGKMLREYFKTRNASTSYRLFFLLLFLFSYLPVFLGGVRFHYHYFMQYLVPLSCVLAFEAFFLKEFLFRYWKSFLFLLLVPVAVFAVWHAHDLFVFYLRPHSQGSLRNPNYLLQRVEFRNVTQWIKRNSDPDDRIYVWGDAPNIYYFAQRKIGARFFIFNFLTLDYVDWFDSQKGRLPHELQGFVLMLLRDFEYRKPRYLVDISPSAVNGSERYPLYRFPEMYKYLLQCYTYRVRVDNMDVWERIVTPLS